MKKRIKNLWAAGFSDLPTMNATVFSRSNGFKVHLHALKCSFKNIFVFSPLKYTGKSCPGSVVIDHMNYYAFPLKFVSMTTEKI